MHLRRVLCSVDDDSNLVHVLLLFRHVSVHGRMLDAEHRVCDDSREIARRARVCKHTVHAKLVLGEGLELDGRVRQTRGGELARCVLRVADTYHHLFQLTACRPDAPPKLAADGWLSALFSALHVGSLRCARLVIRTLAHVLPLREPSRLPLDLFSPSEASLARESFVEAMRGLDEAASPFGAFLLMLLGGQGAGQIDPPFNFSSGCALWRNAQVQSALSSEVVSLLRRLMLCDAWAKPLHAACESALCCVPAVVACLREAAQTPGDSAAHLAQRGLLQDAMRALGALSVLGGSLPSLFVGCRVSISAADTTAERAQREEGVLARWDGAEDAEALVLLDSQLSELRLVSVSALRLLPLDDEALPTGTFALSAQVMPSFECFLPKIASESGSELQSSWLWGLLSTRALKALQALLVHPPSSKCVLDYGMLPAIMASAAMPVPLVGIHRTEMLQTRVAMLEQMHREAAAAARCAKGNARMTAARRRTTDRHQSTSQSVSATVAGSAGASYAPAEESYPPEFRSHVEALREMGFQRTLCQKAVGMFGADMAGAVAWLTSGQARMRLHPLTPCHVRAVRTRLS